MTFKPVAIMFKINKIVASVEKLVNSPRLRLFQLDATQKTIQSHHQMHILYRISHLTRDDTLIKFTGASSVLTIHTVMRSAKIRELLLVEN